MFIDWVSCSQDFRESDLGYALPQLHDGVIVTLNHEQDKIEKRFYKPHRFEGSHDTSIRIKSDGNRVSISGNVGRFSRSDNLFNFGLEKTEVIMNKLLNECDLPSFTSGKYIPLTVFRKGIKRIIDFYTGAHYSRFDLTNNFVTGSQSNAKDFIHWLLAQRLTRGEVMGYGKGETVVYNTGSKFIYMKIYNKYLELEKHNKNTDSEKVKQIMEYCRQEGIVRLELTLKQRYLDQNKLNHYGMFEEYDLHQAFAKYEKKLQVRMMQTNNILNLKGAVLGTYYAYKAGENLKDNLTKTTYYRHKKELLNYGIDISVPHNVQSLIVKPRIIEVHPAAIPAWYDFNQAV